MVRDRPQKRDAFQICDGRQTSDALHTCLAFVPTNGKRATSVVSLTRLKPH